LDSLKFLSKEGLKSIAFVVLENYIHLILQSDNLSKDIMRFKAHTAKQILQYLSQNNVKQILEQLAFYKKAHKNDRQYQFWQDGCHPKLIQNETMMRQKIDYIRHNPVKLGYVEQAEYWRYSSAKNYLGSGRAFGGFK